MDGSTDAGNIEQAMIFALHCKRDDKAKVKCYFALLNPTSSTALECLRDALKQLDIDIS